MKFSNWFLRTRWRSLSARAEVSLPRQPRRHHLVLEQFEDRTLLSSHNTLPTAYVLNPNPTAILADSLAGDVSYSKFIGPVDGELTASVHVTSGTLKPRLTLLLGDGSTVLTQSVGQVGNADPLFQQSLPGNQTFYLEVDALQGAGSFNLTASFSPGSLNTDSLPAGLYTTGVAVGDLDNDGNVDIVAANQDTNFVSVFTGLGNGTFQSQATYATGPGSNSVALGDLNGDHKLDIVTTSHSAGSVSILLNNGDGTFQAPTTLNIGAGDGVALADLNGDHKLDILVTNAYGGYIDVLLGNGDGTFQAPAQVNTNGAGTFALGDLNGDNKIDIVTSNAYYSGYSVMLGNGDGTFQPPVVHSTANNAPVALADLNGDGKLDLVTSNPLSSGGEISVWQGNGDGTFQAPTNYLTLNLGLFAFGDLNGDGKLDIVAIDNSDVGITVLLNNGNGTFQAPANYTTDPGPVDLVLADVNEDGRLDAITANFAVNTVNVLLGDGDGSFQAPKNFTTGGGTGDLVLGDLTNNGRLDVVAVNFGDNTVSVLLGNGDGTFQNQQTFATGMNPSTVTLGDINGDGRLDIVLTNSHSNTLGVLLGNGDGTFQNQVTFATGNHPVAVTLADVNGDGKLDALVTNADDNTVSVLLGKGDGTFQPQSTFAVGNQPVAVTTADLNGDDIPDLVVSDYQDNAVEVLLGNGDGTFRAVQTDATGTGTGPVAVGDVNGDHKLDLAVVNQQDNTVSILLGNGDGTFQSQHSYATFAGPGSVALGDLNGDNKLDIVTADGAQNSITVLFGNGDGSFQGPAYYNSLYGPGTAALGDLNEDGTLDIVCSNATAQLTVLANLGNGSFEAISPTTTVPLQSTPLLVQYPGETVSDAVILDNNGDILFRSGRPQEPGTFDPPTLVNPAMGARGIAIVSSASGQPLIAATDVSGNAVSLYARNADGSFSVVQTLPTLGLYPTLILSGNLSGSSDGLAHDLVVYNALSGTLSIFLPNAAGVYQPASTLAIGSGVSALALLPQASGPPDLLITSQVSSQVTVLTNDGSGHFSLNAAGAYRTGSSAYPYSWSNGVYSLQETLGLVVGNFSNAGAANDIIAFNGVSNDLTLLEGKTASTFLNPVSTTLGFIPGAIVSGDFNNDGNLDLAILDPATDKVYIYMGDGQGQFTFLASYSAGNDPTGISVADVTRPGGGPPDRNLDLLIGNGYGDILVLPGNGNGTFQPYERLEDDIPLAVADLQGNGQDDFIFANQALDQVTVQYGSTAGQTTLANAQSRPARPRSRGRRWWPTSMATALPT